YGLKMLEAGADLSDKSINDLLTLDAKEFTMNDCKVEIAQVNAIDITKVYKKQSELEEGIKAIIKEKNLELFLFVVTDILNNDQELLALVNESGQVEGAFDVKLINDCALFEGVLSRKKQIVIVLTDEFVKVG